MATCENCISKNVCELYGIENDFTPCQQFKDRKKWEEKKRPKTNADHIRSMTDEELAKWLEQWCNNGEMCYSCPLDACPSDTKLSFLDWLKQPAE